MIHGGDQVHAFLNRTGCFEDRQTIGNRPKLSNIVSVARKLNAFVNSYPDRPALEFVTDGAADTDVWGIHAHLLDLGYRADLTALHCMMDLGFAVIKPDVMISRLFFHLGWLQEIVPGLPEDLSMADLDGKGAHGSRYVYTKPGMYRPCIDLARRIVAAVDPEELRQDIGWVTANPLREFDLFMVKSAQQPESTFGLTRTLIPLQGRRPPPARRCPSRGAG